MNLTSFPSVDQFSETQTVVIGVCFYSVSVFLSTSDKLVFKLEMRAGSCTASSMVFSQMARCQVINRLELQMTPSILSSARLEPESTYQERFSSTWNLLWSVSQFLPFFHQMPCPIFALHVLIITS